MPSAPPSAELRARCCSASSSRPRTSADVLGLHPRGIADGRGGIVQAIIGIEAAPKNLEDVAKPLSAEAAKGAEDEQRRAADTRTNDERRPPAQPPGRARGRVRFGPSESGTSWSPIPQSSSRAVPDEDTNDEVDALHEAGPDGLERRAGHTGQLPLVGPGRCRRALRIAERRGDILRSGRSRFVAG